MSFTLYFSRSLSSLAACQCDHRAHSDTAGLDNNTHTHTVTYCPTRGRLRCLRRLWRPRVVCDIVFMYLCMCVCPFSPFPSTQRWNGITLIDGCDRCEPRTHTCAHTNIAVITIATCICNVGVTMETVTCTVLPWLEWDVMFYLLTGILLFWLQCFCHSSLSVRHLLSLLAGNLHISAILINAFLDLILQWRAGFRNIG